MKLTNQQPIKKQLKEVLGCTLYGKADKRVKARGLFKYMGHTFFTAKDKKYWYAYEFKTGFLTVQCAGSEEEAVRQSKHKIDIYCQNPAGLRKLVSGEIARYGFANHAKYSHLLNN